MDKQIEAQWINEAINIINQSYAEGEMTKGECEAYVAGYVMAKRLDKDKLKEKPSGN